jgi:hypothetical protein
LSAEYVSEETRLAEPLSRKFRKLTSSFADFLDRLGGDAAAPGEHVPRQGQGAGNELAVQAITDVILPHLVHILPTRN